MKEALQMCLEYIETNAHERKYVRHAIKEALAQPAVPMGHEQEPVAKNEGGSITWLVDDWPKDCFLYTRSIQLKPLSEAAIEGLAKFVAVDDFNYDFARAIEKAHGIER